MERFMSIIREHPMWVVGGVLVGIIVIWWYSSSGSSTAQSAAYNPNTDPNVIAANAALAGQQSTNQTALGIAQLQATSQGQQLTAQDQAIQDIANASLGAAQAQYTSATNIAQIQATGTVAETQAAGAAALALQTQATQATNLKSELAALTSISTFGQGVSFGDFYQNIAGPNTQGGNWGFGTANSNVTSSTNAHVGPLTGPELSNLFNNILNGVNPNVQATIAPMGSNYQGAFGINFGNAPNTVPNVNMPGFGQSALRPFSNLENTRPL
jgi:hypothetical protein